MATAMKKPSASSQPAKLVVRTEADIAAYRKSPKYKRDLKRALAFPESNVVDPENPPNPELHSRYMKNREERQKREAQTPISIRLDPDLLAWLKSQGPGYQGRIKEILRDAMVRARKSA